jgi:DNA-directed RNA polymerase subunit beta'
MKRYRDVRLNTDLGEEDSLSISEEEYEEEPILEVSEEVEEPVEETEELVTTEE